MATILRTKTLFSLSLVNNQGNNTVSYTSSIDFL